uniref:Uncharacterized protein n=1 Tax=Arundo donax TaxID=35708 RepID=A0A0A9CN54_ARUDO
MITVVVYLFSIIGLKLLWFTLKLLLVCIYLGNLHD